MLLSSNIQVVQIESSSSRGGQSVVFPIVVPSDHHTHTPWLVGRAESGGSHWPMNTDVPDAKLLGENARFFSRLTIPICLSRACLGKLNVFSENGSTKKAFFPHLVIRHPTVSRPRPGFGRAGVVQVQLAVGHLATEILTSAFGSPCRKKRPLFSQLFLCLS